MFVGASITITILTTIEKSNRLTGKYIFVKREYCMGKVKTNSKSPEIIGKLR